MSGFRIASAILSLVSLSACQAPLGPEETYSELHSASGITGPSYADLTAQLDDLASRTSGQMKRFDYGTSAGGRTLTAFRFADPNHSGSGKRPAVLISEGIHGDEYLSITDRLPERFKDSSSFNRFLKAGGVLLIVPVVNPDGYVSRRRGNANGVDLNRDFAIKAAGNQGFTQPETRAISSFVAEQVRELDLVLEASMEYHCCIGGLIHPWAYTATPLPAETLARHREFGRRVSELFGYRSGTVREILGYTAIGGSDDYYLETYGRRAFSFEGRFGTENRNLDKHVELWEGLFAQLTQDADGDATPTERRFFMAVAEGESGGLHLAASAPQGTTGLSLCLGTKSECANPNAPRVHLEFVRNVAGRDLYRASQTLTPSTARTLLTVSGEAEGETLRETLALDRG